MTMATFVDFFFYFVMVLMVTVFWPLSFTSVNHCLCTNVKDPRLTNSSNSLASVDLEILGEETSQSSTIYFNNPHLLKDQKAFLGKGLRNGPVFGYSDVETIGGVYLQDEAHIIARHLRTISNEELGVTSMQAVFDSLTFVAVTNKEEEQVKQMADRLRLKLHKYTAMLQRAQSYVQELYWWHLGTPLCHTKPCCATHHSHDKYHYSDLFGARVSRGSSCDVVPRTLSQGAFCPGQNLTQLLSDNLREHPTIKWQYFISRDGVFTQYPAPDVRDGCKDHDEARHREIYTAAVTRKTKYVVMLIDHGNSMSHRQMTIAKAIAKYIVGSLSQDDQIGLIGLSGEPSYPRSDDCLSERMTFATSEAKQHFIRFIDGLTKAKETTNHSLGFAKAFEMIRNTLVHRNVSEAAGSALILYISRGLLNSLTEARIVLETIADENQAFGDSVTISTYTVIDESKTLMYEKNFMQDIAHQNFSKYIPSLHTRRIKRGVMISVNATHDLSSVVGNPFDVLRLPIENRTYFSLLHWDAVGKGLILSIAKPCLHRGHVIGVIGVDAHLSDVAEDVTSYNPVPNSYSFIVDTQGYVLSHPLYTRDALATEQPVHTDISLLETRGFFAVWIKMKRLDSGVEVLVISTSNKSSEVKHVKYAWQRVDGSPYIVCVVVHNPDAENKVLKTNEVATPTDVVYHQLPLQEVKKCRHLRQLATTKAASLFLSASCFFSPYDFLSQEETRRSIQGYMAYISDNTKLIANPGLKSAVRGDVAALVYITSDWKKRFLESDLNQYIVRRYGATSTGVFLMYPGAMLDKFYDPTKRPWFTSARLHPGRVVLSAPYLDAGGAGYIVTVSHTIYEGKSASMHSTSDAVVAVLALDFTMGYFHKFVMESMPICNQDRIKCFVLDDRGYLVYHPDLIEPTSRGPVEQQHITHKEPLVANDILNHKGFVLKKLCNSFADRTVQRFYQFNTSLEGTLTNLVHGEHCAKYQIVSIPGTNAFLGVVNQTCDVVTAFCPCSTVDRLCLNCHRMEQSECECPCECPLELDVCTGELLAEEDANPSCVHVPDETRPVAIDSDVLDSLEACLETKCSAIITESDCLGVMGCEWCQLSQDEDTPLPRPFCAELKRCFGGILGASTPYADDTVEVLPLEDLLDTKSTPVGPVAGGIMGCFLVLALAVYCYRHHVHRTMAHQFVSSVPDTQVRMSHLDEVEDLDHHEDPGAGHANVVLASFENALNMSPYRVNTGYRRPAGGDSDHGYSTMTPHEDTEPVPYVEPLLVGREKYRPPQSVTSSSRTSSPVPHPLSPPPPPPLSTHLGPLPFATGMSPLLVDAEPPQTVIPDASRPHHVLASVQVHMVDTR